MKRDKIIYWVSTGLLCLMMTASAIAYITVHDQISTVFSALGFPVWLIYPLATAKLLGVAALLQRKFLVLRYMAYAGFFYDFLLAWMAHAYAHDGDWQPALVALALLAVSFVFERKLTTQP